MGINAIYRRAPPIQATYDFNDIANNTGTNIYYLSNTDLISGGGLLTGNALLVADTIPASNDTLSANYEVPSGNGVTYAFDIPFNLSRTIKGDVICYLPHFVVAGVGNTGTCFFELNFYELNGATETFLFSGMTTVQSPTANATSAYVEVVRIPITTRKKISAGNKLRFKLVFRHNVSAGSGSHQIYADPSNAATSQSRLYVPFTLDL